MVRVERSVGGWEKGPGELDVEEESGMNAR